MLYLLLIFHRKPTLGFWTSLVMEIAALSMCSDCAARDPEDFVALRDA